MFEEQVFDNMILKFAEQILLCLTLCGIIFILSVHVESFV